MIMPLVTRRQLEDDDLGLFASFLGGPDGTTFQIDLSRCINLARLKVSVLR